MSSISSSLTSGSGLDVQATVDQLIYTERAPERLMQTQKAKLDSQATALNSIQTRLSSLEDAVFDLKDFTGSLTKQLVTSSDNSTVSASAEVGAATAKHTIIVSSLATTSSWYSKSITDANYKFASGSGMTVQIGEGTAKNLSFDGKSLSEAVDYVNESGVGLRASVVNDAMGTRLVLISDTSGLAGNIQVTSDTTALGWKSSGAGQNAQLTVDGVPIESSTNTVSGVIPNVTLTLSKQTGGAAVTLNVGPDTTNAKQAISAFVSSYNAVISALNSQFSFDASTKQTGVLAGDNTLIDLQGNLLAEISHKVSGEDGAQTLRSLGITMGNDGLLTLDGSALDNAMTKDFAAVRNFFQSSTTGDEGFAVHLGQLLSQVNSVSGSVSADLNGIRNSSKSIQDQIDDFETRIAAREQQLLDEYTRIDVMLRKFAASQTQISAQLGSLDTTE